MKKIVVMILVLIMLMVMFVGCTTPADTSDDSAENAAENAAESGETADDAAEDATVEEPGEAKTIAIIPYYRRDDFYKDLENAMINKCEELGYDYVVLDPDGDFAKILQCVEDAVTKEVDAIAMAPWNEEALLPVLKDVVADGMPIFTFDGYMPNGGDTVTCAIQFDFAACGTQLGELIENYVTDKGLYDGTTKLQTAVIDLPASTGVGVPIIDNCIAYLEQAGIIEVVAQQDGKADRNTAMGIMENILTQTSGNVDLLIGFNYDACMGGVEAADAYGLSGKMIAFSQLWGDEAFIQLEEDDPIYKGGVAYSPVVMAETTIEMVDAYFNGTLDVGETFCEPTFLTHENIGDFDWRAIVEARK